MPEPTIKELRAKTGMSQKQFADRFGISVRNLQAWEQGRKNPPRGMAKMMAEIIKQNNIAMPEGMVSVRELAAACNSTAVVVRSHLTNYADHLEKHIYRGCRVLLLDEYAQNFIKGLIEKNRQAQG